MQDNNFEEIWNTSPAADYFLYFAGGHANLTRNTISNMKLLEIARFFPRIPLSILRITDCKFIMLKYYIQHFFIITIGYYVEELYIDNSYFEAGKSLNFSTGLEFLNIGKFAIRNSKVINIQSLTGNALTVNTASLKNFFVSGCYFYFNAGKFILNSNNTIKFILKIKIIVC